MSGCSVATSSGSGIAFWGNNNNNSTSGTDDGDSGGVSGGNIISNNTTANNSGSGSGSGRGFKEQQRVEILVDSGSFKTPGKSDSQLLCNVDRSYNSSAWSVFPGSRDSMSSYHVIQEASAYHPVEDEKEEEAERNDKLVSALSSTEKTEKNSQVEQHEDRMPKQQSQPLVEQIGIPLDAESPAIAWAHMDESKSCYPKDCEKDHRSYGQCYSTPEKSTEEDEKEKEKEKEQEAEKEKERVAEEERQKEDLKKKEEEQRQSNLVVNVFVKCDQTKFGESLFIAGDWVEWDTARAIELHTNSDIWPQWTATFASPKLTATEYKYYILCVDKQTQIWESLEDGIATPISQEDTLDESNFDSPRVWTPKARNRIFSGKRVVKDVFGALGKESDIVKESEKVDYPIPISILAKSQFAVIKAGFRGLLVAMKTIPLDSKAAVKQAMNEAETLITLDHCCIVKIYSSYYDSLDDVVVIVEEFMDRGSLAHIMYKEKRMLNIIQRLRLLLRVIRGIEYIHERGFIHRDIKSPNILVDHNLDAKLCDFGVTRKEATLFEKMTKIGTPLWMAPEIFIAKHYDCQADIYSFGVVMYEVMEHQLPPERLEPNQIRNSMNCLAPIIKQCLDLSPHNRPKAPELRAILQSTLAEQCRRIADFSNIMPTRENLVQIYEEYKQQTF